MARKGMDLSQFNTFMKRCANTYQIRYITPTIHPRFKQIVAITIHTADGSKEFSITNNPDKNFNLENEVNKYLDELGGTEPIGTVFV
jgi:hypothetical protein